MYYRDILISALFKICEVDKETKLDNWGKIYFQFGFTYLILYKDYFKLSKDDVEYILKEFGFVDEITIFNFEDALNIIIKPDTDIKTLVRKYKLKMLENGNR